MYPYPPYLLEVKGSGNPPKIFSPKIFPKLKNLYKYTPLSPWISSQKLYEVKNVYISDKLCFVITIYFLRILSQK